MTMGTAPRVLSDAELDHVHGGVGDNWTTKKINGGGNEPKGNANGVQDTNFNPGGHPPPGQN
jgi:hypothetical protein